MKTSLFPLLALALPALAVPEDYVNFVRQVQKDTGVEWDVSVASQGEMLSPEGVGVSGALFELWSVHSLTGLAYLLDEEFVSTYTPEAIVSIQTLDPYDVVPRTRVDQPFTVTYDVGGLLEGIDLPLQAKQLLISHEAFAYPENSYRFSSGVTPVGVTVASSYVDANGRTTEEYRMTSIEGEDLTKVKGEETFTAHAISETGEAVEILDTVRLQVWPMAEAKITGLEVGRKYFALPPVQIRLTDLYPDSETFVRISKGVPGATSDPVEVSDSYILIDDEVPQQRVLTLTNLERLLPDDGTYTFEVVHRTPFGTELLGQVSPIILDRTLQMRGTLYSTE